MLVLVDWIQQMENETSQFILRDRVVMGEVVSWEILPPEKKHPRAD